MKAQELFQGIPFRGKLPDVEITGITCDSRQVKKGNLFVCVDGTQLDGHVFALNAWWAGAVCVVAQRPTRAPKQVLVRNTRKVYATLCARFYGVGEENLTLIGVTGTNGKTTVTHLIQWMLQESGRPAQVIGTLNSHGSTTPDAKELHQTLSSLAEQGIQYVAMEASSHALDQSRLQGLFFGVCAFTNLTQDHLDYHQGMEAYFSAKKKLFSMGSCAIINLDNAYGRRLCRQVEIPVRTISLTDETADFFVRDLHWQEDGAHFLLCHGGSSLPVTLPMLGKFSVSNALVAVGCLDALGVPLEEMIEPLSRFPGVPGRMECLYRGDFTVLRDYAHTPDGIEKLLDAVRPAHPKRVVLLFGCGGNRDRRKRPVMARKAAQGADYLIFTSDNPRDECPQVILQEMLRGLQVGSTPYRVIVNRRKAIRWALDHSQAGDLLILAGKGHESVQVVGHRALPLDEKQLVEEWAAHQKTNEKKRDLL